MIHRLCVAVLVSAACLVHGASAQSRTETDGHGNLNSLIARHAAANNLPEELVRRIIKRESRGNARAINKGNYGLMQIRLGTARGLGYRGDASGLLDADTNMTYAVKYLAGAYRAAGGNHDRTVHYYAAGYYYVAKKQRGMPLNLFAATSAANAAAVAATPPELAAPDTPSEVSAEASPDVPYQESLAASK